MGPFEKDSSEDFRRRQFSEPHPATSAGFNASTPYEPEADCERVIIHFDVDAFYAQCEEVRQPSLRERPMGVTQKYLIVTCNYPARAAGVTKLMGIVEAKKKCPDLILINGEDLTPYRHASKCIYGVLQRFGPAERLGMDEVLLDVTFEVERRVQLGTFQRAWHGHLHRPQDAVKNECVYRPMDLRVAKRKSHWPGTAACGVHAEGLPDWELRLLVGSAVAAEARAAVKAEAGFRCSAGIACNRMLAKLISGLHKPDDQTILLPPDAAAFVHNLPVRAFPGVGWKLEANLKAASIQRASDVLSWSRADLVQQFGERAGGLLYLACRGRDPSPVVPSGPPKSITVEDSFKSCTTFSSAQHILHLLAPDLLHRLAEEYEDNKRKAATLTLKWRFGGKTRGWSRSSASCKMPAAVQPQIAQDARQVEAVVQAAMALLKGHLQDPFSLNLLNLGATNFSVAAPTTLPSSMSRLLRKRKAEHLPEVPDLRVPGGVGSADAHAAARANTALRRDYGAAPTSPIMSKRAERAFREGSSTNGSLLRCGPGSDGPQTSLPPFCDVDGGAGSPPSQAHGWEPSSLRAVPSHADGPVPPRISGPSTSETWQSVVERMDGLLPRNSWLSCRDWEPADEVSPVELSGEEARSDYGRSFLTRQERQGSGTADVGCIADGPISHAGPRAGQQSGNDVGFGICSNPAGPSPHRSGPESCQGFKHCVGSDDDDSTFWDDLEAVGAPGRGHMPESECSAPQGQVPQGPAAEPHDGLSGASSGSQRDAGQAGGQVILHVDVDAFYCSVERLDEPSLAGLPVVVTQFNRGGFVSVSHEARAKGIRCGDGVGDAGRAAIPWLRERGAISMEEARRRCPGLRVLPMRTDRYREVAAQVHEALRRFSPDGCVEKASYDDFYLDLTPRRGETVDGCKKDGTGPALEDVTVIGALALSDVDDSLLRGVRVAVQVRALLAEQLKVPVSCGVARTKLLARLASPISKPGGVTVLPDAEAINFLRSQRIRDIPLLRGKLGSALITDFSVDSVGDLDKITSDVLAAKFGAVQAAFIASLPRGGPNVSVKERGPPKSIQCERSFPPLASSEAVRSALLALVRQLMPRLEMDAAEHLRLPEKLRLTWREGYGAVSSRTGPVPAQLRIALEDRATRSCGSSPATQIAAAELEGSGMGVSEQGVRLVDMESSFNTQAAVTALVESSLALLPSGGRTQAGITRFAVGVCFGIQTAEGGSTGTGLLTKFLKPRKEACHAPSCKASVGLESVIASCPQPPVRDTQRLGTNVPPPEAGLGGQPEIFRHESPAHKQRHRGAQCPAPASDLFPGQRSAGKRTEVQGNRESTGQGGRCSGPAITEAVVAQLSSANLEGLSQGLSTEEVADLELALRLQAEEVRQARAPIRALGRGAGVPRKRGPMDAFVVIHRAGR